MAKAVCGDETSKKLTTIPLSNDTVQRRIVELSNNVKDQIVTRLKESKFFSLQLDWMNVQMLLGFHNSLYMFDLLATIILKNISGFANHFLPLQLVKIFSIWLTNFLKKT